MPLKNGRLTPTERKIAQSIALVGNAGAAAHRAGVTEQGVRAALQRPAVQAEIARQHEEMLFRDILPLAVAAHKRLLTDTRTPAGATVQAIKLAYDRTLGAEGAGQSKEPHEMTPEELAQAIAALERVAFERAKPVTPDQLEDSPDQGIFD